jgi:glycosyltransferase involved in cell wall biosynthesis
MIKYPIISIVTVVYNNIMNIEETINNILSLTYPNIEYIIIDGNSTDGTLEVIQKYNSKIDILISESDFGIYDAMNKSIKYCNGEWVIFMNSGDKFFDTNTLNIFFDNKKYENKLVLYGATSFIRKNKLNIQLPENLNNIWKGMPMCHQSMFIRNSYLTKIYFNLKYTYASDYDLLYDIYLFDSVSIENINRPISTIRTKGFSETNAVKTYKEYMDISVSKNSFSIFIQIYFRYKITERRIVIYFKKLFDLY